MSPSGDVPPTGERFVAMVVGLADDLRAAGVGVSMTEVVDAARALGHLDVGERRVLRDALRSCLVKRPEDAAVFDRFFERWFRLHGPEPRRANTTTGPAPSPIASPSSPAPLQRAVATALEAGDAEALQLLAAEVVDLVADSGAVGERALLYRVMRALDLGDLLIQAMRGLRADPTLTAFELQLRRNDLAAQLEHLRRLIAERVHERVAGEAADATRPRRLEDIDVMKASTQDLRQLRLAVRPLARKLASRVAQRRRLHRAGRLDVRRTARRSVAFGGVPMHPAYKRRRATRPDVVVLCDVSGSVAEFAGFTFSLVHALHAEMSRLRSFAFVDGIGEVTSLFTDESGPPDPRFLTLRPGVVVGDGHSDYGRVFDGFLQKFASDAIRPSTTMIVAGDGRTNYRSAGLEAFAQLCQRAKRVYWLNPEPVRDWGRTDSAMEDYRRVCTDVFEVRTLHQLGEAVSRIL
jgi:uncharacterized protein